MKKILIFYASYGGGHLSAANSIKDYLSSNYEKIDVELIDCMKYINKPIEKITTTAYNEMAKKAPWAWGKIYSDSQKGPLAHITTRSNQVFAIKLLRLLREKKPDLIISTHPFGSQMCSYLKRKGKITSKIATILTDFAPHDQWLVGSDYTDYFFVAHNKMKEYLISKNIPENKIFATGIPISNKFLETFNTSKILSSLGLKENLKTVLFFAGGKFGLGKSRTLEIFNTFVNDFNNIQVIAISGKNKKMYEEFNQIVKIANKTNFIKVFEFVNNVPELMAVSDVVITKPGGLTTTESLVSGLPMIIINPIPGQEEENAQFLEHSNVGIWLKKQMNITETISNFLSDNKKLKQMKENTKKISNRNSTKDICTILEAGLN
jgi:processive 1,2-diacylglycerol beta-glucosyltransferase